MSRTLCVTTEQQPAATIAGLSGLVAMAIVVVGNYGLLGPLIVPGKAAETTQNILTHERAFRLTIVCFLLYILIIIQGIETSVGRLRSQP